MLYIVQKLGTKNIKNDVVNQKMLSKISIFWINGALNE